jgi:hypothetical protein
VDVNQTYEQIEYLRDYFLPKIETGTVLPSPKDVVDGTEFILVEGTTKTPHKMISGKWHQLAADANNIIRHIEV